ncbi:MAG TPA: M28 family peptidase [Saprospiraceae bacterium]|nr:M28 family peptidase [Saprospiraceae bacterium]
MNIIRISVLSLFLVVTSCKGTGQLGQHAGGSTEQLRKDISYLASDALEGRETGKPGAQLAATYIATRMAELKLAPMGDEGTYFQEFAMPQFDPHNPHSTTSVVRGSNVIGFMDHGAEHTIVIGAHYDHLGYGGFGSLYIGAEPAIHNGADDNASGVAGLLYLAEVCKKQFRGNNFLFIAFAGEERGLLGSNYFVKNATTDLSSVNFMLNMDMIGRLKAEKSLAVYGVGTSPEWKPVLEALQIDSIQMVPTESGVGPSDHTSFYHEGIPVLHFFTGQHEDYHKPSDDTDKINFAGMQSVLKYIEAVLQALDDDAKLVFQETQDSTQSMRTDFKVTLGVMPDYLYSGKGMRIDGVRPDRPAAKAGILKGDIVLRMSDLEVIDMMSYMEALGTFVPGQTIKVLIEHEGVQLEKEVTFD